MKQVKCYDATIGDSVDDCINYVLSEMKMFRLQMKRDDYLILVFNHVPLYVYRHSTFDSLKDEYKRGIQAFDAFNEKKIKEMKK